MRLFLGGGVAASTGLAGTRARGERAPDASDAPMQPMPGFVVQSGYGGDADPPDRLGANALDPLLIPPPAEPPEPGRVREVSIWVNERPIEVAGGRQFAAWTYNDTVPGPLIRATEGDELAIHFQNRGMHPHNVHFHGRHAVSQDGWQPIPSGESETYRFRAGPAGFHPYHCHALPVSQHIAKGLYGALIVDPPALRPAAHEFSLVLCGFDLDGDGKNELYAWNGIAGFFARFPIKVPVGELVRLYLLNMVSGDPVASFHLHAETFDVYRTGTRLEPDEHTDVVSLAQAERVIIEFRLPERGRYMFHPHQVHMAERGAMGWFSAI
ncbi:MAG: multicopper oxidase domain-containing protein [bacterium]|nr:multicopper oxidase domain-containing protein [bacterium]MCP5067502.1 multicopper oxidase domain-containing protein [bacterium]